MTPGNQPDNLVPGFYWVCAKGDHIEIAKWDGEYWWTTGEPGSWDKKYITCLSITLEAPDV